MEPDQQQQLQQMRLASYQNQQQQQIKMEQRMIAQQQNVQIHPGDFIRGYLFRLFSIIKRRFK